MNREETLALYAQGSEAWNEWANEMLAERKRLEEAGEWNIEKNESGYLIPKSDKTRAWFYKTHANFSDIESPHTFQTDTIFSDFIFPGRTNFRFATFNGTTDFSKAIFHGNAGFNDVTFNGDTSFNKTKFYKYAGFIKTHFNKAVNFWGTLFEQHALFGNCKFCDVAGFKKTKFNSGAVFANSIFKDITVFDLAHFVNDANFNAISCERAFSLEQTKFQKIIPDFIQVNFKEAPRLDNIEFSPDVPPGKLLNSITTPISPDIKASYQALKRLAIQAHDHENEQRFWAGELRSDRSLRGRNSNGKRNIWRLFSPVWYGNILYDLLSNYGRSIVRPLIAWIGLTTLVTALHIYAHTPGKDNCNICVSAAHVAVKTGSLGLIQDPSKRIVFVRDYACLYGTHNDKKQTPKIPGYILLAEGFQALISAILIFLFLLGLRNNFKLK